MDKKRLIVEMTQAEHSRLLGAARALGMTLSNYVRRALDLPEIKQGVKRTATARPAKAKKPAAKGE
jgi:hypothetical protein